MVPPDAPPPEKDPSTPPVPDEEAERLAELASYDILDTPPEALYEQVVTLAAHICQTPMAAVSLIGEDRNWLKARHGFQAEEFPREAAFCAHAVSTPDELTVVPDASGDPRFASNPIVEEPPGVRFYAGAPLRTPGGRAIGTVCVLDDEVRSLTADQAEALEALSTMVMTKLELRRRSRELRARTAELERRNKALDEFAGLVSHELKDPLGQVLSNLDLADDVAADLDEETRTHLRRAVRGGERIEELIRDLLLYARANGDGLAREPVRLQELVDDAREELEDRLEATEATVDVEGSGRLEGDPTLLVRVVENLLANAEKYSGDEPPRIRVDGERGEEAFRVAVEDEGIGIPEDEQEEIFDLFTRGSATGDDGTGLGLALSQRIVERHDGEMGVESTPGEGSTFWFTLPHRANEGG